MTVGVCGCPVRLILEGSLTVGSLMGAAGVGGFCLLYCYSANTSVNIGVGHFTLLSQFDYKLQLFHVMWCLERYV